MGTSNWQNIPYCIDALMKMAPRRVLDVGVGFGRWGVVTREFCDVWYGRIFPEDWNTHVEGIEGFPRNIAGYHRHFYNVIHEGDAAEIIPRLDGPWDVVIFGDVLEHFHKDVGGRLLDRCLERSSYVMVNVPLGSEWPQDAAYGNEFERHLAEWNIDDFAARSLVRRQLFQDYIGRPFGTFILSREDPKDLASSLFSPVSEYDARAAVPSPLTDGEHHRTLEALQQLAGRAGIEAQLRAQRDAELAYIKQHRSYRLAQRIRKSPLYRAARRLRTADSRMVTIRALGERSAHSQGEEVWLLAASPNVGAAPVPWDFCEHGPEWALRPDERGAFGQCLVGSRGEVRVPVDSEPTLQFLTHPWSGMVEVQFGSERRRIDLYSAVAQSTTVTLRGTPSRQPALVAAGHDAVDAAPALNGVHLNGGGNHTNNGTAHGAASSAATLPDLAAAEAAAGAIRDARAEVVAVHCPRYLGVSSSTSGLFEHLYPVDTLDEFDEQTVAQTLDRHADLLAETGAEHIVLSGGDERQLRLAYMLHDRRPDMRIDLFWHGSYIQFREDDTWRVFRQWTEAARQGIVYSIASDKAGFDRFVHSLGLRGAVLLNRVNREPMEPPEIEGDAAHIGMWLSGSTYRKIPHAMLAAMKMMPDARLHAAGLDGRALEVVDFLGLEKEFATTAQIPHDQLLPAMRRTHLTMYVTFVECCPMLPLESLSMGVPCIFGPNSHLLEDNEYLFQRLVVPFPDRAEVIADYAVRAMAERREIIDAYRAYYPAYRARSDEAYAAFMAL